MALTSEQTAAIERLRENESLTDNLTDTDARALLDWAQNQIIANADSKLVQAAVSAANASGLDGVQPLLAQATTFLAQQLAAHGATLAPTDNAPAPLPQSTDAAPASETTPAPATSPVPPVPSTNIPSTAPAPSRLEASGQAAAAPTLSAHADAAASPITSPSAPPSPTPKPIQKSTRKSRRKKKNT